MVVKSYFNVHKSYVLLVVLLFLVIYDISLGSLDVSWSSIWKSLFDYNPNDSEELTVRIFRIPRVLTAVFAGMALAVSGLLMQTLFQNPLAGPYVLGINSGASLAVAITTMTGLQFFSSYAGIFGSAIIGALIAGAIIVLCSLYVRSKVSLLLVGIMLGSFAGALVNVIQSYSNPEDIKVFLLWSFGSLQNSSPEQLKYLILFITTGLILTIFLIKPLNILVLGDQDAKLLGVNLKQVRLLLILITAILTGVVTAYCGPIAFIGLIVPNIIKFIYKSANHGQLLIGSALGGGILLVLCDILMQLSLPYFILPLNAITALIGAPIIIWIIIKRF